MGSRYRSSQEDEDVAVESVSNLVALVDVNNIYVSCERAFNPACRTVPLLCFQIMTAVLSIVKASNVRKPASCFLTSHLTR